MAKNIEKMQQITTSGAVDVYHPRASLGVLSSVLKEQQEQSERKAEFETIQAETKNEIEKQNKASVKNAPKKEISVEYVTEKLEVISLLNSKNEKLMALKVLGEELDNSTFDIDTPAPKWRSPFFCENLTLLARYAGDYTQPEILEFLQKRGANPALRLEKAVENPYLPFLPNIHFNQRIERYAALEKTLFHYYFDNLKLFIQNGADVNALCSKKNIFKDHSQDDRPNAEYLTPLECITTYGYYKNRYTLEIINLIKFLLEHGATVTPLVIANLKHVKGIKANNSSISSAIFNKIKQELLETDIPCNMRSIEEDIIYRFHKIDQYDTILTFKDAFFLHSYFPKVVLPVLEIYHEQYHLADHLKQLGQHHMPRGIIELIMQYNCENEIADKDGKICKINDTAKIVKNACTLFFSKKILPMQCILPSGEAKPLLCGYEHDPKDGEKSPQKCLWLFGSYYIKPGVKLEEETQMLEKILEKRKLNKK